MYRDRSWQREDEDDADRQTASLAGVAVTVAILVIGLFVIHALQTNSTIEDCLMAARQNCDRLIPSPPTPPGG